MFHDLFDFSCDKINCNNYALKILTFSQSFSVTPVFLSGFWTPAYIKNNSDFRKKTYNIQQEMNND
ncbi:MAG: hypothetical protein A3H98_12380 [Bacteroidetes bacterium RIFCSPLOWO2_02_FULL_36_8]|nr:MAG: hypothetical protein A3H98_12380 [Bacteroidetes bacterium RIFCSPLOWO2_02_FULL_36_8]OFY71091.1 MAG: hypothetical protein A3G23_14875 [Bacteroidetes bacterium RIFCSPLOWO2_12_FULL_37_12]